MLPLTPMKSVQSTPPNARWVPNARVLIYKIDPLSPSPLLFGVSFTIKRHGMKQYPFLFVSNIATTKNNTSLGRIASVLISYDQNHNTLQLAKIIVWSGFYVTNYTQPIPFLQVPQLGNGLSNLDFPPL